MLADAPAAVLNVKDLEGFLASSNVKVTTSDANGAQATNIRIAAKLVWAGLNSLTLDAFRSVTVDKPMQVKGTGGLYVYTDDGGRNGAFSFGTDGYVAFANLSSPLEVNATIFTLVSSVSSLASAVSANPSGAFALANNYDARQDGTYTVPPVSTVFTVRLMALAT